MPILPFTDTAYSRDGFRIPAARLQNMYKEATPAGPGKDARLPRPGLSQSYSIGLGPILGMFQGSGVVGGNRYAVSGTQLYKDTTLLGTVASGTRAAFAGSATQLVVIIGGNLYVYDGTTLSQVRYFKWLPTSTLTLTGNATATETVTLGSKTYTFVASVSVANDVKIGATASDTIDNLIAAINAGTGAGTLYGTGTTINPDASAAAGAGDTMIATAKVYNTINPYVTSTERMADGGWYGPYLVGGLTALPYFTGVVYSAGRFYFIVRDTDQYYWSDIDDATMIDGLSFATAESAPDFNVAIAQISDEIWFFGKQTVEPWYQTGQAEAPLQRSQGRRFEKGCAAQFSVVPLDNTLFFIGNDHLVYRSGQVPMRVSTHAVESAIDQCADISTATAYAVWFAGHSFYVLNIPGVATWAYDVSTGDWAEWSSYGLDTFIPTCSAYVDNTGYLGSGIDGKVYVFDRASQSDAGQVITYLASAFLPVPLGQMINFSLMLQSTRGLGSDPSNPRPVVEMRYSDDAAQTWSDWRQASLGMQGQYSFKAIWRCLGQVNSPGRHYEFRTTSNVPIVYEFITYNQATP